MPLCIAGMHRSGTSMVTRLLNLCGLEVGPREDLLRSRPSNPEGFWENRGFIRINDAVLREWGGTWQQPPPGQEPPSVSRRVRKNAVRLLRRFDGREPWGWKDPRNCLTLPFWRRLLPGLPVLLCVRHPLEVARSLHARDGLPVPAALDLWLTYNRSALASVSPAERIVTHHDSYFQNASAELARVLTGLRMEVPSDVQERACASINPSLWHHRRRDDDPAAAALPREVRECYQLLCQEAEHAEYAYTDCDADRRVRETEDEQHALLPADVCCDG